MEIINYYSYWFIYRDMYHKIYNYYLKHMQIVDYDLYWATYYDICRIIKYNYFTIHLLPIELFDNILSIISIKQTYHACRFVSKEWNCMYKRYYDIYIKKYLQLPLEFWFCKGGTINYLLLGPDNQFIYPRYL